MSKNEIANWMAIYAAAGLCCAIAFTLAVVTVGLEFHRERGWTGPHTWRSALVFVPKLWWRWQKRYLVGAPATLAIVAWFALTLDWSG